MAHHAECNRDKAATSGRVSARVRGAGTPAVGGVQIPEPQTFPDFFVFGMLKSMKWPRKVGLLKKHDVVDPMVVEVLCVQLAELGVTLGAGRPAVAAQLLADLFRERDWAEKPLSELLGVLDPSQRVDANSTNLPWESISTLRFKPASMPWELLANREFRGSVAWLCAEGLVWGLLHPSEAVNAINQHNARVNARVPEYRRAGLALDPGFVAPSAEGAFATAEEMVTAYQEECRRLVPLPVALAGSPEIRDRLPKAPEDERNLTLAFVRHFQFLLASQQLTMEIYNGALEEASSAFEPGDELFTRGGARISSPAVSAEYLLPALREKNAIIDEITATHEALAQYARGVALVGQAYDQMSQAITVWRARGMLQQESLSEWIEDPSIDVDTRMSSLDAAESRSTGEALAAINPLFGIAQIDTSAFHEINRSAFNSIRVRRGLSSLGSEDFQVLYSLGKAGGRPRFFSE